MAHDENLSHVNQTPDYYDPVKAHEYYLRTRELKGRQKASDIKGKDKQKQWADSQKLVNKAKQNELTAEAKKQKENLNKIRFVIAVRQKEIQAQIKQIMDKVAQDAKAERDAIAKERQKKLEQVSADLSAKIAAIPPIPKGISAEKAAELKAARDKKISELTSSADSERKKIAQDAADKSASSAATTKAKNLLTQTVATKKQQEVAVQLKASINQAQNRYLAIRDRISGNYELKLQSIYNSIATGK